MERELVRFIESYEEKVVELSKQANLAYFDASISGKEEDYKRASELQLKLSRVYANKEDFETLKKLKADEDKIEDPLLKRQLTIIYNDYAGNQFSEELLEKIVNLSTKTEEKFSTYRAEVDGKKFTDNEIDGILEKSTDNGELENVWKASKQIGKVVEQDVINLVKMRNEAARELGYSDYHTMSLSLSEQDPEELTRLFDELDELTRDEFAKLKNDMDEHLSEHYGVAKDELMPWHYQDKFFQQGPTIYPTDLDKFYKNEDVVELTRGYFNGIGLEIDDLIKRSDLYEKEGKYQHAYCTDIDRSGDVRVLCNVKPNYKWMGTMLHEYGHAVYDKYVRETLPWALRQHAHIFTTEAIAMLFGRFASNPQWLVDMVSISETERDEVAQDCYNSLKLEQLTFSRWVQVMFRFEREMYGNPDQDLNALWWNLVEKYQMLKKPEGRNHPDWAAKIHVALYPAYYHNYMLGELLASQLHNYITTKVLKSGNPAYESFHKNSDVGEYLKHLFFAPGSVYHWSELIIKSTGEELTPKYYANQFVE